MTRRVHVVGHADADGHLIAEQVRRNLSLWSGFCVTCTVDPARTEGHRAWLRLAQFPEIKDADLVFFVDLMFSPADFDDESQALVDFATAHPNTHFFVMDHHPLPLRRLMRAGNIRVAYRPDVFDCAIGPRSGMMVVAALCERQGRDVEGVTESHHEVLASGMRRAAAHGGSLAGAHLMNLLGHDRWDIIMALGEEPPIYHRLVRGRRPANALQSELMAMATRTSRDSYEASVDVQMVLPGGKEQGTRSMPYDAAIERFARKSAEDATLINEPTATKDLEALVTMLEIAALSLSASAESTFSRTQLIAEARNIAGEGFEFDERDAKIVLEKATFVRGSQKELRFR